MSFKERPPKPSFGRKEAAKEFSTHEDLEKLNDKRVQNLIERYRNVRNWQDMDSDRTKDNIGLDKIVGSLNELLEELGLPPTSREILG